MTTTHVETRIHAPVDEVFRTVADIHNFATAVPEIVDVEFLSERRSGVGTRFRETREMGSRSASTVLEVTEYVENERVRLVSEAGGAAHERPRAHRDAADARGGQGRDREGHAGGQGILRRRVGAVRRARVRPDQGPREVSS